MSQLNDISLVAQVVVFRNTRAFDRLVGKYQSSVRRFFLHLTCGDSELSDDLAQDTFIKAYTNLASFKNLSINLHLTFEINSSRFAKPYNPRQK
jgi:RNA polymerase sigma-70 factor (ECF subfamily)